MLKAADNRLQTALKYGPQMYSSRALCVSDAVSLIRDVLVLVIPEEAHAPLKAAVAALTQHTTFDADIKFARKQIADALAIIKKESA